MAKMLTCLAALGLGLLTWTGCGPSVQGQAMNGDQTGSGSITPGGVLQTGQTHDSSAAAGGGSQGSAPDSDTPPRAAEASAAPAGWLRYSDGEYGFAIDYPDSFTIVPELDDPQTVAPALVKRVRFLDKALAASDTANLQPPQFSVEVFENADGTPLDDWLSANAPSGERTRVAVGTLDAVKVTLMTLLAPGEFYYVVQEQRVFKLTPLGEHGEQMLMTFTLQR